jgi:hypothetical protein
MVWLLIWDNASWHVSRELRRWLGSHNRCVKESGCGVRIVSWLLPKKSSWLNAIEPKWVHGKRKVCRARGPLGSLRARQEGMQGIWLPALRASIHSTGARLIVH